MAHISRENGDVESGPDINDIIKLFSPQCNTLKEIAKSSLFLYKEIDRER